ncbi:MAG TPA: gas vesicle protein [Thermoanaerobaculia bacterium]|nr:gas vesicle protein [Thermoanaerobaculia bacterium]
MNRPPQRLVHSTETSNLADILERVLDKGIVIAGDIKIKLVDIELLTIQVRLLIASVDKAREMGMDWWLRNPDFSSKADQEQRVEIDELRRRVAELEVKAPVAMEAR